MKSLILCRTGMTYSPLRPLPNTPLLQESSCVVKGDLIDLCEPRGRLSEGLSLHVNPPL